MGGATDVTITFIQKLHSSHRKVRGSYTPLSLSRPARGIILVQGHFQLGKSTQGEHGAGQVRNGDLGRRVVPCPGGVACRQSKGLEIEAQRAAFDL